MSKNDVHKIYLEACRYASTDIPKVTFLLEWDTVKLIFILNLN